MPEWQFDKPSQRSGSQFRARDWVGELVAFIQPDWTDVTTQYGEQRVAACPYVVGLTGPNAPAVYKDAVVFGAALPDLVVGDGTKTIGLGRVYQGPAKSGQSGAWLLEDPNEEDELIAKRFFDEHAEQLANGRIKVNLEPAPPF